MFKENATFKFVFLLSYHVNNKTLHTPLNYMHLPLKRTSSYKSTHTVN